MKIFDWEIGISRPRYMDIEDSEDGSYTLNKYNKEWGNFTVTEWVYDYSTMKMIRSASNSKAVTVSIECYPEGKESEREEREIKFVLEGGEWYLDDYTR